MAKRQRRQRNQGTHFVNRNLLPPALRRIAERIETMTDEPKDVRPYAYCTSLKCMNEMHKDKSQYVVKSVYKGELKTRRCPDCGGALKYRRSRHIGWGNINGKSNKVSK